MSQTACWGTNNLERCAWVSFGYGSCHDCSVYWVSLDAAKALARLDYGPINLNAHEWYGREEEYKQLCPRLRMAFSAWSVSVPGDEEESLRWWVEIEKEMGKHGMRGGTHAQIYKDHPEDKEIHNRCEMMSRRADESRHGFMDVCHDETVLNICTEDHRFPNGGGTYRDFMSEEEILLTEDDDIDALIIAKAVLTQFLKFYGADWMDLAIDGKAPPEVDMTGVNPFDPKNSTGMYIEKIEIDGTLFTLHLYSCEGRLGSYFRYTFDRSEAKPDWDYINAKKAEREAYAKEEAELSELEMLEWGQTWEEMANDPKCRYEYNENFVGDIFDPTVYLPRSGWGHYRYGSPEKTELGDWYIFGGPLVVKEFVSSPGRKTHGLNSERYRNYQCPPNDFFIFGGLMPRPMHYSDYQHRQDYWANPALP